MEPAEAPDWLTWLQQSRLAAAIQDSPWLYPAAEILHIVAFVAAIGCLLVLDFRLLGLGRRIAFDQVAGALLPWAISSSSSPCRSSSDPYLARLKQLHWQTGC